jgi:hypothetical protein
MRNSLRRKSFILLIVLFIAFTFMVSCSVVGSGTIDVKTLSPTPKGFTNVQLSNAFKYNIEYSTDYKVKVRADDNLFDYLVVERTGDTLSLGLEPGSTYHNISMEADIQMPMLEQLSLSGACSGNIGEFNDLDKFALKISGASKVESGIIKVNGDSMFKLSGSSYAKLSGSADNISINVSGASKLDLSDFTVENANIDISGASKVILNASGKINGSISGASTLHYYGDPVIGDLTVSGASSFSKLE